MRKEVWMNEIAAFGQPRMTVKEVAEALGVTPEAIKKHVRELYPESIRDGKNTYLTEEQVTRIKARMMPTTKVVGAVTDLEMMEQGARFAAWAMSRIAEQDRQLAAAAPKVEFFDAVAESKDAITMREVAAALNLEGWGRNRIFAFLREQRVLDEQNIPYRYFQDKGYFRVVERKWSDNSGETHISLTTLVFQRGVEYIREKIKAAA